MLVSEYGLKQLLLAVGPNPSARSADFLHLANLVCRPGCGGWDLKIDVVNEYVGQFLHQRFGLGVKITEDFIRAPSSEELDQTCGDIALEECSSPGASKSTNSWRCVQL